MRGPFMGIEIKDKEVNGHHNEKGNAIDDGRIGGKKNAQHPDQKFHKRLYWEMNERPKINNFVGMETGIYAANKD